MKICYILAWIGLILSITVHLVSILGPGYILSDIDGLVWLLHGGVILLGLPTLLSAQRSTLGTKEKSFWTAAMQNCPLWMKRMTGLFFLYGIISFIIFTNNKEVPKNSHSTPASVFRGFSGAWMLVYSVEVAILYSYLKKKISDASKSVIDQVVPMDSNSRRQYDLITNRLQTALHRHRRKIIMFLIVGIFFLILIWLAFKGYPWFLGCTLFSLSPFFVLHIIYAIFANWRAGRYLQKNHFKIWKKGKSSSYADRIESQKLLKELDDPYLKLLTNKAIRFSTICFWVWLVIAVLIIIGLTLLPESIPSGN